MSVLQDFKKNSNWTELCVRDSDGDGRTNGEELGDPDCEWVLGGKTKGKATSHPGNATKKKKKKKKSAFQHPSKNSDYTFRSPLYVYVAVSMQLPCILTEACMYAT